MRAMFDQLAQKEVVNTADGKRLGSIVDLEIELSTGQIYNIVVPGQSKFLGLIRPEHDYLIPWGSVIKIGDDVILVDMGITTCTQFDA